MNNDVSQMHDRAGYWLFRQMGVPAPRAVHAKLTINGTYTGLYSLVEQIDSRFIKENFDDDDGNFDANDVSAVSGTWDVLYKESLLLNLNNGLRFISNF